MSTVGRGQSYDAAHPALTWIRTGFSLPVFVAALDQGEPSHPECHVGSRSGGKGQTVARKPETDWRQADFFGAPAPTSAPPEQRPAPKPKPKPGIKRQPPPSNIEEAPLCDSIDVLAARLSRIEWNGLVAGLPDDALAHLVIATVRQLRRRLARSRGRDGKGRVSTLERSAQQIIVELSGQGENGDDW